MGDLSKQHLVGLLLLGMLVLGAAGTLIGAVSSPEVHSPFPLGQTAMGILFCGWIVLLLAVNRLGYWKAATWGALACLVLSGSVFLDLGSHDRVFIVTAVPVVMAAFLLRPRAAFELAALSGGCYVMEWIHHGPTPSLNVLSLLALAGVALVAWLTARRVAWLEEAEDMSRRELDRLADERDVLKGQVRALADEVGRAREAAESSLDAAEPRSDAPESTGAVLTRR